MGQSSPGYPFLLWWKGMLCLSLMAAFFLSCQHFKQLVEELQAKGVGTVNKALTESFKILREVRMLVLMGTSVPAHPLFLPLCLNHILQWEGDMSLSPEPQNCNNHCTDLTQLWGKGWFVHDALRLLIPAQKASEAYKAVAS